MVSGPHLWRTTRFVLLSDICGLPVLGRPPWREDGSVIYSYSSLPLSGPSPADLMTTFYCLIWDSPNLEVQVPVFISPRNSVAQLYPRALGSLFVASYDSQGYGGGIITRLHTGLIYGRANKCVYIYIYICVWHLNVCRSGGITPPLLTSALDRWECVVTFTLPQYPIDGRLVESHSRCGCCEVEKNIFLCRESNPGRRARRYTDRTIPATNKGYNCR
jgi:hypothetical protein